MSSSTAIDPGSAARRHRAPLDYTGAAAYLNLTERHLQSLVQRRLIPYLRLGRLIRFDADQLDAWLAASAVPPQS